ncbi:hypothetical protein ColKHC_09088 [Colletotrichum higginsianum]|nr:hypothetical protein ColKHC_09088 [Colletotrichum higginsianum]
MPRALVRLHILPTDQEHARVYPSLDKEFHDSDVASNTGRNEGPARRVAQFVDIKRAGTGIQKHLNGRSMTGLGGEP